MPTTLDLAFVSLIRVPYVILLFNDTVTTEIYTLSLHDALPILAGARRRGARRGRSPDRYRSATEDARNCRGLRSVGPARAGASGSERSEEHTSELQSRFDLVCRLLLEKKKKK